MTTIHKLAAKQLQTQTEIITNRLPKLDCYEVKATDEGFRYTLHAFEKPGIKGTVSLDYEEIQFTVPYSEIESVVEKNLDLLDLVSKYNDSQFPVIDTAMFK